MNDSIYNDWKEGKLTRYEEMGILKPHIIPYCRYYEEYMKHRKSGAKFMEAVEVTAENMATSADTVKRAIAMVM